MSWAISAMWGIYDAVGYAMTTIGLVGLAICAGHGLKLLYVKILND